MMTGSKKIHLFQMAVVALSMALLGGCTLTEYEIEEEGHTWRLSGLANDSVAVVKVTFDQWGTEHDHHFMGYDDDFHWTKDTRYYQVKMNSYGIAPWSDASGKTLSEKSRTDEYGLRFDRLDSYSPACGVILLDKKKRELDTLEIDNCSWDEGDSAKFVGNYVKMDRSFYLVKDGRFPSQKPAYRVDYVGRNIKFTDANGDYIIYGGKP